MKVNDFPLEKETHRIIGAAMEVHRQIGPGFLEGVYQECLAHEFRLRGIPFVEHPRVSLKYKGVTLGQVYVPDFIVFQQVVVELKAIQECTFRERAQVLNAVRAAERPVGLLLNFGAPSLFQKRFVNTRT